jgi:hypothetical protein
MMAAKKPSTKKAKAKFPKVGAKVAKGPPDGDDESHEPGMSMPRWMGKDDKPKKKPGRK